MTLDEWIAKYEGKAEKYERLENAQRYFVPEHGFMDYVIENGSIIVDHTCTDDIHYMHQKAREIGKENGCTSLFVSTHRNPKAYLRLNKFAGTLNLQLSGYRPNGKFYWFFEEVLL